LPSMIREIRSGKMEVTSSIPARLAYRLVKLKARQI
jgi:hypothetical protein